MVPFITKSGCVRAFLAALAGLQFVPTSLAAKGDTGCRREMCVSATVEGDMVNCKSLDGLYTQRYAENY